MWWLAAAGLMIIAVLAVYAALLVGRLIGQRRVIKAAIAKRNQRLVDDIRYIAQAMLEQRCDLSEGVIRITHLQQALQVRPIIDWRERYPTTYALYEKVQGLAIMEQRQALPCAERRRQDEIRTAAEQGLQASLQQEAQRLSQFALEG